MIDQALIPMLQRGENHQALLQVLDRARVFITQMLVNQVGTVLDARPIHRLVVKQVDSRNGTLKVYWTILHRLTVSSLAGLSTSLAEVALAIATSAGASSAQTVIFFNVGEP